MGAVSKTGAAGGPGDTPEQRSGKKRTTILMPVSPNRWAGGFRALVLGGRRPPPQPSAAAGRGIGRGLSSAAAPGAASGPTRREHGGTTSRPPGARADFRATGPATGEVV